MNILQATLAILTPTVPSPHHLQAQLPLFNPTPNTQSLQTCPSPLLSCPLQPPSPLNPCCINHPSGHFLLAQFWDTSPSLGPNDSWTLHGLWPDLCTGGYEAYCDRSRRLPGHTIAEIAEGRPALAAYMRRFWKGLDGDESLWAHEWAKHGTCVSTIEPRCYRQGYPLSAGIERSGEEEHLDVLDYLSAATVLHASLQTYDLLARHNITPSHEATYSLSEIQTALASSNGGHIGTVKCNSRHELNEIWMHFVAKGVLRDVGSEALTEVMRDRSYADGNEMEGEGLGARKQASDLFIPAPPDGLISTCPRTGIKYLPKSPGHPSPSPPSPQPTYTYTQTRNPQPTTSPSEPFTGRGYLRIHVLESPQDTPHSPEPSSELKSVPDPGSDRDPKLDLDPSTAAKTDQSTSEGCLIRKGLWYTSGTCATYHAKTDININTDPNTTPPSEQLFTLSTSLAPCAILESTTHTGQQNQFVCANHLPLQSIFGVALRDGKRVLSWKRQSVFFAEKKPERFEKVGIFADDGDGLRSVRIEVLWESV